AFAVADAAVRSAIDAQHAIAHQDWGALGPFRVRMAIHTGVVEKRGIEYAGAPINLVGRLLAAAHGGQVLVSAVTESLVQSRLRDAVRFTDLGMHRLRDLSRPERIFQITAPDLPANFPPIRSADPPPNTLPLHPNPLIGRDDDVAKVCALLRREDVRLVTLTGAGGTGKTRLAIQVASELAEDFTDEVFFVPLAAVSDPALVASTIAAVLGLDELGDRSLLATISDYLRNRQVLLLLDNFEQLLAANAVVADLIAAGPGVTVLVTSRFLLQLSVEHAFAVPPLEVPDPASPAEPAVLAQVPAVTLFVDRAQASRADFTLTPANATAVAELSRRLDGLPLAIELAAARVRVLPPAAILSRLEHRLSLLAGSGADRPSRQQTLRGTIQWSYDLLSAEECRLFRRLAVFAGGWSLESADAVVGDDIGNDILEGLGSLVDKSLVVAREDATGEARFHMLETLREFGREQLRDQGEDAELQRRHAEYFLGLAEQEDLVSLGTRQPARMVVLDAEYDNLRAALAWGMAESNADDQLHRLDVGVRLGRALYWYWYLRGFVSEGRAWLDQALERLNDDSPPRLRALAAMSLGSVESFQGDVAAARPHLSDSITLFRQLQPESSYDLAVALVAASATALYEGDDRAATAMLEESKALFQRLDVTSLQSTALVLLGAAAFAMGDQATARTHYEEALGLQRSIGYIYGSAQTLNNLGELARLKGDDERARSLYSESLAGFREAASKGDVARALHNLGHVALHQGQVDHAAGLLAESLALFQERGNQRGIAECLVGFAALASARGNHEMGLRLLGAADAQFTAMGAVVWPADRPEWERIVTATQSALDEHEYAATWSHGRELSLDQAATLALESCADG
ncbi:MAG: tetratricopeptide repeat protein, partial [Hyphomicrobiales bacterium]|nr:tetratricopeptide repeat protein [Hyphomicrobiales bacterium]